jgi:hypothetical protein
MKKYQLPKVNMKSVELVISELDSSRAKIVKIILDTGIKFGYGDDTKKVEFVSDLIWPEDGLDKIIEYLKQSLGIV